MNLQELSYLEVYNHVYEEIKKKEKAQIKIRRWWTFVNCISETTIVRLYKTDSNIYNKISILYLLDDLKLCITTFGQSNELYITFNDKKQVKMYLLFLCLRAINMFKIQVEKEYEFMSFGTFFQLFE